MTFGSPVLFSQAPKIKGLILNSVKNTGMQNGCSTDQFSLMQSTTSTLFQTLIVLLLELIVSFQAIFHINVTLLHAFTVKWHKFKPYIFPPFNLIGRILQKIRVDQTTALCVFPKWPSQAWWPMMKRMMITPPMIIPASKDNLILPNKPTELHLLYQKMDLIICQLSGDCIKNGI